SALYPPVSAAGTITSPSEGAPIASAATTPSALCMSLSLAAQGRPQGDSVPQDPPASNRKVSLLPLPGPRSQVVLKDAPQRPHPVLGRDLLPLRVRPPRVAHAHLVHAAAQLRHLGRDLRLEAEAVLLDRDPLDHLAPEDLEAHL